MLTANDDLERDSFDGRENFLESDTYFEDLKLIILYSVLFLFSNILFVMKSTKLKHNLFFI